MTRARWSHWIMTVAASAALAGCLGPNPPELGQPRETALGDKRSPNAAPPVIAAAPARPASQIARPASSGKTAASAPPVANPSSTPPRATVRPAAAPAVDLCGVPNAGALAAANWDRLDTLRLGAVTGALAANLVARKAAAGPVTPDKAAAYDKALAKADGLAQQTLEAGPILQQPPPGADPAVFNRMAGAMQRAATASRSAVAGARALLEGGGNVAAVANNHVYVMALRASLNADQQRLAAAPLTQLFTGNGGGLGLAAICLAGAAEYAMNGVLEQVSGRPRGQDYLRYAAQGLERWKRAAADPETLRRFDPVAPQEDAQFQAHWAASELLAAALEGLLQNPSPEEKPYRAAQAALRKSETAAKAYWDVVLKGAGPNTVAQARR